MTVRISPETREMLRRLAAETGESMQAVLERAVEAYRREHFLQESNRAFAALRADAQNWRSELQEREAWDATLGDHLESD